LGKKKHIAILGSTGSIGRSTLDVLSSFPDRFDVPYLTAHRNLELLREQVQRFRPRAVAILDETNGIALRNEIGRQTEVLIGQEGLRNIVTREDVDLVVSALVGIAGLKPTLWAIEAGKDIALANKETLVVAGALIMRAVHEHGVRLIPVDSEHSAILQCLQGERPETIERVILTASGGPFLHLDRAGFESVSVSDALNHPTWKMGNKITIDSATLMNKGLEVIEAHWLFGLPAEKIDVVVHPQSIIHSFVEFVDGSVKAQLGVPDMKLPIQYALMFPERMPGPRKKLDLEALGRMTFLRPDVERFPCLRLAYRALEMGGTAPAVLNAANEVAVQLFLDGRIPFTTLPKIIEEALLSHIPEPTFGLDEVLAVDARTRQRVMDQQLVLH
jgi:1-deoxy-D-xylulose-5-phosphate reductoisomerase